LEEVLRIIAAKPLAPDDLSAKTRISSNIALEIGIETVAIVQARMGSTRFPNKYAADRCRADDELLLRVSARPSESDPLVLATSIDPAIDQWIDHVKNIGYVCIKAAK